MRVRLRSARAGGKSAAAAAAAAAGDLARKEEEKSFKAEEREIDAARTRLWLGRRRKRDSRLIISDEFSQRLAPAVSTTSLYRRVHFSLRKSRAHPARTHARFPAL